MRTGTDNTPRCKTCRYAHDVPSMVGKAVFCRRHSPHSGHLNQGEWPLIGIDDWCGDHEEEIAKDD